MNSLIKELSINRTYCSILNHGGLAMINKDRENFQYKGGDLVYIISPLTSQLRTNSQKITTKYVGPVVVYKIVDPCNYLLMMLGGKVLKRIFDHERLKTHCYQKKSWECSKFS